MANAFYTQGLTDLQGATVVWTSDTIKVLFVDTGSYTFSGAHTNLSQIAAGAREGTITLSGKTDVGGVCDAADAIESALAGAAEFEALVIYKDTGVEATSRLLAYFDTVTGIPGLPLDPGGNTVGVTVAWNNGANRVFDYTNEVLGTPIVIMDGAQTAAADTDRGSANMRFTPSFNAGDRDLNDYLDMLARRTHTIQDWQLRGTGYVRRDGTLTLSGNWDAGDYEVCAEDLCADNAVRIGPNKEVELIYVESSDFLLIRGNTGTPNIQITGQSTVRLNTGPNNKLEVKDTQIITTLDATGTFDISADGVDVLKASKSAFIVGTTIYGGDGSGDDLTLEGTNHATKTGSVFTAKAASVKIYADDDNTLLQMDDTGFELTRTDGLLNLLGNLNLRVGGRLILDLTETSTTPYNIGDDESVIFVDTTGGTKTANLPGTPTAGVQIIVKNVGSGGNTLTVGRNGNEIDGDPSDLSLTDGQKVHLVGDGSNWESV